MRPRPRLQCGRIGLRLGQAIASGSAWTNSLVAVERLDRLTLSLRHLLRPGGQGARRRRASREPRAAARATQSRIWRFALDGSASQLTHGPNGDYSAALLAGRRPACLHLGPRSCKGKADLFILEDGAARPLGDIPGTIEDMRWTSDGAALVVLAADRGLDGGATNGAQAPDLGRARGSRGRPTRRTRGGGCSRSTRRRRDGRRSARPISASGSSTCSATTRGRARLRRPERARLVSRAPRADRFRDARRDSPASIATGSCWRPAARPRASASPSSKAGRATAAWSRARSASSTLRPASSSTDRRRRGVRRHVHRSGATTRASGSPAGRSSARSTASSRLDGKRRLVATRGRDHRHQQLLRRISPAPDKTASPRCARRSASRRRSCSRRSPRRDWKPVTQLNARRRRGLQRLSRGPRASLEGRGRSGAGGPRAPAHAIARRAAADDRRHPRRPELGGEVRLQSRLRAAVRGRRLRGLPAQLPRQYRLGPGIRAAQYRRSRRRRVRGHPRRHRPLRRRGLRRSRPARRHRGELRRLHDGLGGRDHRPLQGRGHGLRHRQSAEQPLFLQPRFPRLHQRRAAHARSATATSRSTARRSCGSTSRRRRP